MVGVKCNRCFIFGRYFYRKWLSELICQINLLACLQFFCSRKLCNLNSKNSVRIRHAIGLFRHQMNVHSLAHFHISYRSVKSMDHLSGAADKFQRFTAVIRRIKLCSVVKRSSVMGTTGLSYIAACQSRL